MTLQQNWENESKANAVTTLFGYDENGNPRQSAIPAFFDDWFHGDFETDRPDTLLSALSEKSLEEYTDPFPDYRINSVIEIGFDTNDGETISDYEIRITNPDDSTTSGGLSPITLEGGPDEPGNPFRNEFDHYDDDQSGDYLPASQKGPHTKHEKITVNGIDGVRGSIIFGGSDAYLKKLKEDGVSLAEIVNGPVRTVLLRFFAHLPAFYTFLDFAFMADGSKAVRVWDASRYPAHALYVDGEWEGQNEFRENIEWTVDGAVRENTAFNNFALDAQKPGATPFGQGGSFGYRNLFKRLGAGDHPVISYMAGGANFSEGDIEIELSEPMFPDNVDNPDII